MKDSSFSCTLTGLWAENRIRMSTSHLNRLLELFEYVHSDISYDKATFVLPVFHCEEHNQMLGPLVPAMTAQHMVTMAAYTVLLAKAVGCVGYALR